MVVDPSQTPQFSFESTNPFLCEQTIQMSNVIICHLVVFTPTPEILRFLKPTLS